MDFRLLRHLSYFKVIADERHFGRAAKRLGISQPPLSQQIKVLETNLGIRLFDRSRSGVSLTDEGRNILPAVERFLNEGEQLESAVLEARHGRGTRIHIGAIAYTISELLPGILAAVRSNMPDVSVNIQEFDSSEALGALERDEVDVAFLRAEARSDTIKIVPLVRERLVIALPLNHPLAKKPAVDLQELGMEPMVFCPRFVSPSYFDRIIEICRAQGLSPRIAYEARSITSQLAIVSCGVAIGLVPESMSGSAHQNICFVPFEGDASIVTAAIAWNAENSNVSVKGFVDLAIKALMSESKKSEILAG